MAATLALVSGAPAGVTLAVCTDPAPEPVLLEAGADPRVALRYALSEGTSTDFQVRMVRSQRTTFDGTPEPWQRDPAATTRGTRNVLSTESDGAWQIENILSEEGLWPLERTSRGVSVRTWQMDDRGRVLESGSGGQPEGPVSLVLPEEAVGRGAVWETTGASSWPPGAQPLFEATTTTRVTLVEILPNDTYLLEGTFVMSASDHDVPASMLPEGVEARYDDVHFEGQYRWLLDPTDPVVGSTGSLSGNTVVTVSAYGRTGTTTNESVVDLELWPAGPSD